MLKKESIGFLASMHSSVLPGLYSKKCDNVDLSCGCLLLSVAKSGPSLFPDMHECVKTADFVAAVRKNPESAQLCRIVAQFASFASDCTFEVIGAVLGPLLSLCASLSEASLTAFAASHLFQNASSIFPK